MIPKKIHYCWFGKQPLPQNLQQYIDSWRKYCPDYEIIEWNEENYDVNKIEFTREAYRKKQYAFVSDYARLDILYHNGGFYFDTDVELLKPLTDLRNCSCFFGCELRGEVNTGLGFGGEKQFDFFKENMLVYESHSFSSLSQTCVEITTDLLRKKGLKASKEIQRIGEMWIYPPRYFSPKSIITGRLRIGEETYSIHHYEGSWKHRSGALGTSIKIMVRLLVDGVFGTGCYRKILRGLKIKK